MHPYTEIEILAPGPLVRLLCALLLAAAMGACADSDALDLAEADPGADPGSVSLTLRVGFDNTTHSGASRAETAPETTRGTDFENTIRTLTLYVVDPEGHVRTTATFDADNSSQLPFIATDTHPVLTITKEFTTITHGDYDVYVAANLSENQRLVLASQFADPECHYILPGNRLNLASDLTSKICGMAMSCTAPERIQYSESNKNAVCTFDLQRVAAKALVTAATTSGSQYAVVDAKDENGKQKFLVPMESLYFTVNSVNTRTYLYQRASAEAPGVIDPDMVLSEEAGELFVYHPVASWNNFYPYLRRVRQHNLDKCLEDPDYLESAIYFPENTFTPTLGSLAQECQVTHVVVHAKIIPLTVVVPRGLTEFAAGIGMDTSSDLYALIRAAEEACPEGKNLFSVHCTNADDSSLICELALRFEDFETGGISSTTFFVNCAETDPASRRLYTYAAAKMLAQGEDYRTGQNNSDLIPGFEIYEDGYADYTVFFREPRANLDAAAADWMWSQVYRNTYYILCIDKFVSPGQGYLPNEKYIKVHTKVVNYKPSYNGQIEITDETPVIVKP